MSPYRDHECPHCSDFRDERDRMRVALESAEAREAYLHSGVASVVDSMRRDLDRDRRSLSESPSPWVVMGFAFVVLLDLIVDVFGRTQ